MSAPLSGNRLAGGESWDSQYGPGHFGAPKIRREALRNTEDGRDIYEELFDTLTGTETILDAGCYDGDDEINLRVERGHTGQLIGMEVPVSITIPVEEDHRFALSSELVKKHGLDNIHFMYGYLEGIPLEDKSVDLSWALWSLIHVDPAMLPEAISELERVTRQRVAIGTNGIDHKPRQHQVVSEIGEILGIQTPKPFSSHLKLDKTPQIVTSHSTMVHRPDLAILQRRTNLLITPHTWPGIIHSINTYRHSAEPVPEPAEWSEAMLKSPTFQTMIYELQTTGQTHDMVDRGIEFFDVRS